MPRTRHRIAAHNGSRPLSVGHQQMTEILRILMLDAKVVIMDELTAALTERETATLFKNDAQNEKPVA